MQRLIALLAVLVLALVACGESAEDTTTTTDAGDAGAPATTQAPPATDAPATTEVPVESSTTSPGFGPTGTVAMTLGEGSEVRFYIGEVLAGRDVRVEGVNQGVTGEATIDFDDPDASTIGTITIDAAGFVTDETRRNGAIQSRILASDAFPEITFEVTEFTGAADVLAGGTGTITGNLVIRESSNPVTFEVSGAEATADGLTAFATATVDRNLWELPIPRVPLVASVEDEVTLEMDIILTPVG